MSARDYGLGRIPEFDERSRQFRATALLTETAQPITKTWRRGGAYDQGATPHCVAFTGKGILNTAPASSLEVYDVRSKYSTDQFYAGAQRLDQWPGENYDGTSGLGLAKYLREVALIKEYRWCFGLTDVLLALSYEGPVGIGVNWYTNMFYPNSYGYIGPGGEVEGGHEVELIGVDTSKRHVIGMNSWGTGWGPLNGRFLMTYDVLDRLLSEQGDAVVLKR